MRAGKLRESIEIFRELTATDADFGSSVESFVSYLETRADVRHIGGGESLSNNTVVNTNAVVFWIRFKEGITETMQVEWRGDRYAIEYIEEDRKLRRIKLQTSKILN